MTDREGDAPRTGPDDDTDQFPTHPVSPADAEAAEDGGLGDEAFLEGDEEYDEDLAEAEIGAGADEEVDELTVATAGADEEVDELTVATAGAVSGRLRLGQRLGRGDGTAAGATTVTPSERAVRIDDRASQVFVVGVLATFLGILLFGMLWGAGGFFTTVPASPSPSLVEPGESASPTASLVPSASPSAAGVSSAPSASAPPSPSGS
jgi:hypothetical protein